MPQSKASEVTLKNVAKKLVVVKNVFHINFLNKLKKMPT